MMIDDAAAENGTSFFTLGALCFVLCRSLRELDLAARLTPSSRWGLYAAAVYDGCCGRGCMTVSLQGTSYVFLRMLLNRSRSKLAKRATA